MIEVWKMTWMLALGILCLAIPMGLMVYYNAKYHAAIKYAFMGGLVFLFFALVLEQALHALVIPGLGLKEKPWAYVFYGALAAGLFEEIPRYFVLKRLDRDHTLGIPEAKQYGVGHGGVEMVFIVGLNNISNYLFAKRLNTQGMAGVLKEVPPAYRAQVKAAGQALMQTKGTDFFYALLERCLTLTFHICLAILAFFIVRGIIKKRGLVYLVGIHFLFDLPAAMAQVGLLKVPFPVYYGLFALADLCLIYWIRKKIQKHKKDLKRRPEVARIQTWPKVVKDPFGKAGSPDRQ